MLKKRLLLFTNNFPSGFGEHFLETSVQYYAKEFDHILIIPRFNLGNDRPIPSNASISYTYSEKWPNSVLKAMLGGLIKPDLAIYFKEISNKRNRFIYPLSWYRLLSFYHRSDYARNTFEVELAQYLKDGKNNLFYTYWLGVETMGLGMLKQKYDFTLVSRVHNGDLYEERYKTPYLPFQKLLVEAADKVYCIAEDGRQYLNSKYPEYSDTLTVSRLGTEPQEFTATQTTGNILHVVSCSNIVSVKRVDLIIDSLAILAESHPEIDIKWTHIGDGILARQIKAKAADLLKDKVEFLFKGNIPNHEVFTFYKNNPVDVFVNLSKKEGIPVSIMEALSVGIPVVATNVGGTGEIVNNQSGTLLDENASARSAAEALYLYTDKDVRLTLSTSCIKEWKTNYNGPANYTLFSRELRKLLDTH